MSERRRIRWWILALVILVVVLGGTLLLHLTANRVIHRGEHRRSFDMRTAGGETVTVEIYWRDYRSAPNDVNRNAIGFYLWQGPLSRQRMGMFGEKDRQLVDVYVEGGAKQDFMVFVYDDDGPPTKHRIEANFAPVRLDRKPIMLP